MYKNYKSYKKHNPGNANWIRKNKKIKILVKTLGWPEYPPPKKRIPTPEECINRAKKYKTYKQWRKTRFFKLLANRCINHKYPKFFMMRIKRLVWDLDRHQLQK